MGDFTKYGKVRLIWGTRITHEFDGSIKALEWRDKMLKSWRKHFVSACMVYNDKEMTEPMVDEFDMLRFMCDSEDFGFHRAYEWVQEGRYGQKGIPQILVRPRQVDEVEQDNNHENN